MAWSRAFLKELEAQRIAVLLHAEVAAVGCVLTYARAPPFLEAVFVDPLGGAAAGARLHERAVLLTLKAHPAPLLLLARSILAGSSTGEEELHRKTRRGGARSHSDRGLHVVVVASKFGGVLFYEVALLELETRARRTGRETSDCNWCDRGVVLGVPRTGEGRFLRKALKNAGCAQSTANVIYSIFWHRASARA